MVIVIMGVSGAGKTTVGSLLASKLHWSFRDGDEFHPAANVAKMASGSPLTDDDRWPWLQAIHAYLSKTLAGGSSAVVACSALKAEYRRRLADGLPVVRFVHLSGTPELLAQRVEGRRDHFMPPGLLGSQLAILEAPSDALVVDIAQSPEALTEEIIRRLEIVRPV
jgi:gluconokinase